MQRKHGSGLKSYTLLADLFRLILKQFEENIEQAIVLQEIGKKFPYLVLTPPKATKEEAAPGKKFTGSTKSGIGLKTLLEKANRCYLCDSRIHVNSISFEHIEKKQAGGYAIVDNGDLSHPLCNSLREKVWG